MIFKVFVMTANEDMERFKLVIAGDGACGKTSLLTVFKVGYRKVASRSTCYYSENQVLGGATN